MNQVLALQELPEKVGGEDLEVTPMSWWMTVTTVRLFWSTASNNCNG